MPSHCCTDSSRPFSTQVRRGQSPLAVPVAFVRVLELLPAGSQRSQQSMPGAHSHAQRCLGPACLCSTPVLSQQRRCLSGPDLAWAAAKHPRPSNPQALAGRPWGPGSGRLR
mmetsp:Transcript_18079/g.57397  ORF Transcript_18079/g.57397 Transcript_18079/m.57397 type:complete len:112 (-) Transcript_18079:53-388(-)